MSRKEEWTETEMLEESRRALSQIEASIPQVRESLDGMRYVEAASYAEQLQELAEALAEYVGELRGGEMNGVLGDGPPRPMRIWRDGRWLLPNELPERQ
jgi:hypothetical protein